MKWEQPGFIQITMNAEIGGYQTDFDSEMPAGPRGPVLDTESIADEDHLPATTVS